MENGEKKLSKLDEDDIGYSEKKIDTNRELQAGQWLDLKHKNYTRPQKIHIPKRINPQREDTKIKEALSYLSIKFEELSEIYIQEIHEDINRAEGYLKQIQEIQVLQRALFKALLWQQKGMLDITKLPKEAQNLLK